MGTPLSERQWKILRAAVDRIIPGDEFPSGWDGGVGDYLEHQFGRDLREAVDAYRRGLDALDEEARAAGAAGFPEMEAGAQDALLARAEKGKVGETWAGGAASFFAMLVEHAMEGYYSDHANNRGNRDGVAWKMIGFEVRG